MMKNATKKHRFKAGDIVIFKGIKGVIEKLSTYSTGKPCYELVSIEDEELICTASEEKCELLNKETEHLVDKSALTLAKIDSAATLDMVEKLTDKNFRDGNH